MREKENISAKTVFDAVKENDAILVKASHGMKFEKIVEVLKQM